MDNHNTKRFCHWCPHRNVDPNKGPTSLEDLSSLLKILMFLSSQSPQKISTHPTSNFSLTKQRVKKELLEHLFTVPLPSLAKIELKHTTLNYIKKLTTPKSTIKILKSTTLPLRMQHKAQSNSAPSLTFYLRS